MRGNDEGPENGASKASGSGPEPPEAEPKPKAKPQKKEVRAKSEPKPKAKTRKATKGNGHIGSRLAPGKASKDEVCILKALVRLGKAAGPTEVAKAAWAGKKAEGDAPKGKPVSAYRRAVNGVRRLVGQGMISRPESGSYEITAKGRGFLRDDEEARAAAVA